jgi:hypothetical protein
MVGRLAPCQATRKVACKVAEVALSPNVKKKKGMRWEKGQELATAQKTCRPTLKGGTRSALNSLIAIKGA